LRAWTSLAQGYVSSPLAFFGGVDGVGDGLYDRRCELTEGDWGRPMDNAEVQPRGYRRPRSDDVPPNDTPSYRSTALRHPTQPLVIVPQTLSEITGPAHGDTSIRSLDYDLTRQHASKPIGERIVIAGRVVDEDERPVPDTLVEIWQANAAGRYAHVDDTHDAPLDVNFTGAGRVLTDRAGRYRFVTVKPGAYPWNNHDNAWRPAHVHISVFGQSFLTRLVTQMYFPGDPLLALDPIFNSIPSERARRRLVSAFDLGLTEPLTALGYRFDIVLRGRDATPTGF
jgi:protocatechuate 3,4-dioxygenase beta subunit